MKKWWMPMLLLALSTGLVYGAEGRIPISDPVTITAPGSYIVTDDITRTTAGVAIEIQANDVSIDLDGHIVTATVGGYPSIRTTGYTNIRVTNGSVRGYSGGIWLRTGGGSFHVEGLNITVTSTGATGILIEGNATSSAYSVVKNNIVTGPGVNGWGIRYEFTKGLMEGNKVAKWSYGMWLESCTNVFVEKNIAAANATAGIYILFDSNYNVIRNNSVSENASGIILQDSHFNTIESNSASGNTNYGIRLYGGAGSSADYNNVEANTTACGNAPGIDIDGCGNIYSNNKAPGGCTIVAATCNISGGGNF